MKIKKLSALLTKLADVIHPPQLDPPHQSGFGDIELHNTAVDQLKTDLSSIMTMVSQLHESRRAYVESCREMEAWAEDRYLDLQKKIKLEGYSEIKFLEDVVLPPSANLPLPYKEKVQMPFSGKQMATRGPWSKVVAVDDTTGNVEARWRVSFERYVPISEVKLSSSPEIFSCYRVVPATVQATIEAGIIPDVSLQENLQVIVDVLAGPHAGSWFYGTVAASGRAPGEIVISTPGTYTANGANYLQVGESISISIPVKSYDIGRGTYEIEEMDGPVWANSLDLVLGSTKPSSWLGLPAPQFSFKIYKPFYKIRSLAELDPKDYIRITTEEYKPVGSSIEYNLVQDLGNSSESSGTVSGTKQRERDLSVIGRVPNVAGQPSIVGPRLSELVKEHLIPIIPGIAIPATKFKTVQVTEDLKLNRYLEATMTYPPAISPVIVAQYGNRFDPNLDPSTGIRLTVWENWNQCISGTKLIYRSDNFNPGSGVIPTRYGASRSTSGESATDTGLIWIKSDYPAIKLPARSGISSSLFLKPERWNTQVTSFHAQFRFMVGQARDYLVGRTSDLDTHYFEWSIFQTHSESIVIRLTPIQETIAPDGVLSPENFYGGLQVKVFRELGGELTELFSERIDIQSVYSRYDTTVTAVPGPILTNKHNLAIDATSSNTLVNGQQYIHRDPIPCEAANRGWFELIVGVAKLTEGTKYILRFWDMDNSGTYPLKPSWNASFTADDPPLGGGMSFTNNLVFSEPKSNIDVDIDSVTLYANSESIAPIKVQATLSGKTIPQQVDGSKHLHFTPEFCSEILEPVHPNRYELSMVPIDQLNQDDIKIWAVDVNGLVGELLYSGDVAGAHGKVAIQNNVVITRGLGYSGPIKAEYWGFPQVSGKVPFTYNATNYVSTKRVRTLRPFNDDIESDDYYPVIEYRHSGKKLSFAQELERVQVSYTTYGTLLRLEATLSRGTNPSRSPRLISGRWDLA